MKTFLNRCKKAESYSSHEFSRKTRKRVSGAFEGSPCIEDRRYLIFQQASYPLSFSFLLSLSLGGSLGLSQYLICPSVRKVSGACSPKFAYNVPVSQRRENSKVEIRLTYRRRRCKLHFLIFRLPLLTRSWLAPSSRLSCLTFHYFNLNSPSSKHSTFY